MKRWTNLNWCCSQQSIQVIHHSYPLLFGSYMFWCTCHLQGDYFEYYTEVLKSLHFCKIS
jgi:hypothetical protein